MTTSDRHGLPATMANARTAIGWFSRIMDLRVNPHMWVPVSCECDAVQDSDSGVIRVSMGFKHVLQVALEEAFEKLDEQGIAIGQRLNLK